MTTPNDRSVERAALIAAAMRVLAEFKEAGGEEPYFRHDDLKLLARATLERAEVGSPKPRCGLSWSGHNVWGDAASIEAVKDALHDAGTVPQLKDIIKAGRAEVGSVVPTRSKLLWALMDKASAHSPPRLSVAEVMEAFDAESGSTQAGREPLTDGQICKLAAKVVMRANFFPPEDWIAFARAIERALAPSSTPPEAPC